MNNFERITENADALAIFLEMLNVSACDISLCNQCPLKKRCQESKFPSDIEIWQAWLKQEVKER